MPSMPERAECAARAASVASAAGSGGGRKIPPSMENPVDNLFIAAAHATGPALCAAGVTPNMVSVASLVVGAGAAYAVLRSRFLLGAALLVLAYWLDCLDGNLARTYGAVTRFGDTLDHVSDAVKFALLLAATWLNPVLPRRAKVTLTLAVVVLIGLASGVHMSCQEKVYAARDPAGHTSMYLSVLPCPGGDPGRTIAVTRYLGLGTAVLVVALLLVWWGLMSSKRPPTRARR